MNQNNALNLFSSKEQEYEQRSQLLKRLAFVILCCENDQFHKHMPDIQGIRNRLYCTFGLDLNDFKGIVFCRIFFVCL